MTDKSRVHLTLDEDIVSQAKMVYPNLSIRVNELLSQDLNSSDEEAKLVEEMEELMSLYNAKKRKLCKIRKQLERDGSGVENVLDWAKNVYYRKGVLGLNLLEMECKRHKVSFDEVRNILEQEDVALVKFAGVPKGDSV